MIKYECKNKATKEQKIMNNSLLIYKQTRARKKNNPVIEYENMKRSTLLFVKVSKPIMFFSFLGGFLFLLLSIKSFLPPIIPIVFFVIGFATYFANFALTNHFTRYENRYGRIVKESKHTLKTEEKFYI